MSSKTSPPVVELIGTRDGFIRMRAAIARAAHNPSFLDEWHDRQAGPAAKLAEALRTAVEAPGLLQASRAIDNAQFAKTADSIAKLITRLSAETRQGPLYDLTAPRPTGLLYDLMAEVVNSAAPVTTADVGRDLDAAPSVNLLALWPVLKVSTTAGTAGFGVAWVIATVCFPDRSPRDQLLLAAGSTPPAPSSSAPPTPSASSTTPTPGAHPAPSPSGSTPRPCRPRRST
jgi:hypothetical protein